MWNHPHAPFDLNKRLVRTLIKEIVVSSQDMVIRLMMHWQGGQHTKLVVRKNPSGDLDIIIYLRIESPLLMRRSWRANDVMCVKRGRSPSPGRQCIEGRFLRVSLGGEGWKMRLTRLFLAVVAAVLLVALPGASQAQLADPYVSCVKCHALPSAQAQARMAQHGVGYPPVPEMACMQCHDTFAHEQNPSAPAYPRYFLWPDPTYSGPDSSLTNHCAATACHPDHLRHGHAFDEQNNPLLEKMPYGTPPMGATAAPASVLPLFDPLGTAVQDRFMGGMVCSTCHDPHEPSYPFGQEGTPKFLRVGSPSTIIQLCSACHDAPFPSGAAPDLVIPSRSNSVSFATGPVGDQQITVTVKNRGNAWYTGGPAQVSWVNDMGYQMLIGSLPLEALSPEQETTVPFGWMPPPDWTAGEGFYTFSLPPSGLLPGAIKEFVRAMNVTPAPTNLRVSYVTPGSIELMWDIPAGGPLNYEIYRDGLKIDAMPVFPPFIDGPLAPETPHVYTVKAVGADGIPSAASNAAGGTTLSTTVIRVPQDYPTIQQAINAASMGTSIHVAPGTYTEVFSFQGREGITIKGQDANGCVLDYSANPETIIDLGPAFSYPNGNTLAGFTIRDARILMFPGDVLSGCVVQSYNMPPYTYSAIFAMGGLAAQCIFDAPFAAAEIPPGGFFAAVNSAFLYAMPFWHPGTQPAAAALLLNNSFDSWPQYVEYHGSGNFMGHPTFETPGPWPPPGTFFTTQASVTTDRGLPLGTPETYNGAAPDVGVFEVGWLYTPKPPSGLTATFQPGTISSVRLDWTPSVDAPPRVQYYLVYRAIEPFFPPGSETTPYMVLPAWSVPTFTDTNVAPGTIYYYQVRADAGPAAPPAAGQLLSAPSNTASAGDINREPLAVDDAIQIPEDQITVVLVLENDVDPDGDALTLIGVTQPGNGVASLNQDNTVTYAPAPAFAGDDSFSYTVTDGRGGFATATVTVAVIHRNRPPVAIDDLYTTREEMQLAVWRPGVLANDSDPEGAQIFAYLVAGPTHGTLLPPDIGFGDFIYVPNPGYTGTDSFLYYITDGSALSNVATVTITVIPNSPPVAGAQSVSTNEDTGKAITLAGTDADGDALSFTVATQPAHGMLTGAAPNLTYTPTANYNGPDSFTFTASDGLLTSAPATVTISVTPINDAPVADPQSVTTAEDTTLPLVLTATDPEGNPMTYWVQSSPTHGRIVGGANLSYVPDTNYHGPDSFTFTARDGALHSAPATVTLLVTPVNDAPVTEEQSVTVSENATVAVTLAASDVDGDTLTFTVAPQPAHGTLTGTLPNLTYTPAPGYYGPDSFSFVANDGAVDSAAASVSVIVSPAPRNVVATASAGGTISPAGSLTVPHGTVQIFTITSDTGYHIASVAGCGGTLVGTTYTTAPVTVDCSVAASFAINRYTLAVAKSGAGSGTVTSTPSGISCGSVCSADYEHGSSVTLTAVPTSGSLFSGWSGACSGTGSCVVTVDSAKSVTATFALPLTVTAPNGGENWKRNNTYAIRWVYAGSPGSSVKIELLKDGKVNRTITKSAPVGSIGSGSYNWKMPSSQTLGSDFRIRVTSTSNGSYTDTSDGNFTIAR